MLVDHLSEEWLAAVDRELAARDRLRTLAATCPLGVTQVVTGGDDPVVYHFSSYGGAARAAWGEADPEDVRIVEDATTAAAIAAGRVNAGEAFITGRVVVTGDRQRLVAARALLGALDEAVTAVAAHTRFAGA
jgi:hypothetical protein